MAITASRPTDSEAGIHERLAALLEARWSKREIRDELGLVEPEFRRLLSGVPESLWRQWRANRRSDSGPPRYTREQKIAAVKEAARLNGGQISIKDYDRLRVSHKEWPSSSLLRRAEGWNWWVEAAGLKPQLPGPPYQRYTDGECEAAARRVSHLIGRTFSLTEYDRLRKPGDPTAMALRDRFGNGEWVPALKALLPNLFAGRERCSLLLSTAPRWPLANGVLSIVVTT